MMYRPHLVGAKEGGQVNTIWSNAKFRAGWKSFEKMLRNKLSSMQNAPPGSDDYNWGRLIQDSLDGLERIKVSALTTDVFETHRSVIVRIHLPPVAWQCKPSIIVGNKHVTVSGIPGKTEQTISLPERVTPRRSKAELFNGILEIRLRKRSVDKLDKMIMVAAERASR